ncbi:hypothetical protein OG349_33440 [Streptomyces sp. NBC_01317]|uniref:hypothetical protein n=1 Tax=Streptomyces sp. NBC_01317 TaxID=2903822 RepID=UPI002E10DFD2|nr:hypothetical protein OG349_33440 [Streptomyces sp. NBC_01317]
MTTYVVTIPGTLHTELTDDAKTVLLQALRPADPQGTDFGAAEDLDLLSVDTEESRFTLRLEVTADDSNGAEQEARRLATGALEKAGFTLATAPIGQPFITGIDRE